MEMNIFIFIFQHLNFGYLKFLSKKTFSNRFLTKDRHDTST